jgi:hypothetical protein
MPPEMCDIQAHRIGFNSAPATSLEFCRILDTSARLFEVWFQEERACVRNPFKPVYPPKSIYVWGTLEVHLHGPRGCRLFRPGWTPTPPCGFISVQFLLIVNKFKNQLRSASLNLFYMPKAWLGDIFGSTVPLKGQCHEIFWLWFLS